MEAVEQARPLPYLTSLELSVRSHPLQALGIGFLTGFVVGGGQNSRAGQGLLGFAARLAVRQIAAMALSEALRPS
jgi:hypothetical protein